jgi:hypothetical protein
MDPFVAKKARHMAGFFLRRPHAIGPLPTHTMPPNDKNLS